MNRLSSILVVVILLAIFVALIIYNPFDRSGGVVPYPTAAAVYNGDVLTSEWNGQSLGQPSVIYDDSAGLFKMWYVGNGSISRNGVGYATSKNGTDWNRVDNGVPVLQSRDQWEAGGITAVSVLKEGKSYHMWYSATDNYDNDPTIRIGYATSADGINWAKAARNPILEPNLGSAWDNHSVDQPSVARDGSIWRMWYTGRSQLEGDVGFPAIGSASSVDGLRWTRDSDGPVFSSQAEWDGEGVITPFVTIFDGGKLFEMWFAGTKNSKRYEIGRAYSVDGLHWIEDEFNPLMSETSDSLLAPSIHFAGGSYQVWMERSTAKRDIVQVHAATYKNQVAAE